MTDEYIPETHSPELSPWLYPELFPEYAEPTAPVSDPEPTPEPVPGTYPPELFPWLYPDLFPEYAEPTAPVSDPSPEPTPDIPVLELPPEPTPEPVPEATSPVITVDDLLNIIQSAGQASGEELSAEELPGEQISGEEQPTEEPTADPGDVQAVELDPATLALIDAVKGVKNELIQISDQVAEIQLSADSKPLLTTPFEDYSVSEGLLLLLLLSLFLSACYKILRGGLQWLRS